MKRKSRKRKNRAYSPLTHRVTNSQKIGLNPRSHTPVPRTECLGYYSKTRQKNPKY